MLQETSFSYTPKDFENERASNSYLMSMIAIMVGLPLPIINLLATAMFYLGNRKSTYFVRWHCTQALLSQLTLFVVNAVTVGWVIYIIVQGISPTNAFFGWLITALLINLIEFIMTIYTAIVVRKGRHVEWWFWGALTDEICTE